MGLVLILWFLRLFQKDVLFFFVATLSEAVCARASAPEAIIYVLNGFSEVAAKSYEIHRLSAVLGSLEDIDDFEKSLKKRRPASRTGSPYRYRHESFGPYDG